LIASEDIKFWTHPGIDWEAIKNATDLNLHEKRVVLGGSTITMQTAKNLYLNFDRNLSRKFEEILIAWHLEKIFTKKQILETYINIVEFGPNIFGLKNAAKHFFDKSPENLNLLESVYLGSILPSPIKRYRHFCEGRISQGFQQDLNEKIGKLVNFNFIDQWEGEKASKMTLTFHRPEGIEDSTLCQRSLALSSSR
jgi:monofunctional biosynthetic peptidoglycan transglycosylase